MRNVLHIVLVAILLVGCNSNEPDSKNSNSENIGSTKTTLSVRPDQLTFWGFATSSRTIYLECNTKWEMKVENKSMFQLVYDTYGEGNREIHVYVPEIGLGQQKSFTTQHGSITFSCKDEKGKAIAKKVECTRSKY